MKFKRGDIVHHKIMGKGVVLNEIEENGEKKIELRVANGQKEKFYPEELESDDYFKTRIKSENEQVNRMNKENAARFRF